MKFLDLRSLNAQKRHFKFLPYLIEIGGNGQKLKIAIWTSKTSKIGKIRGTYPFFDTFVGHAEQYFLMLSKVISGTK